MSTSRSPYHHGDLRAACLRAAMELLEEGGTSALSLRAVARRAGVSPAAPYRHYADRDALISAVGAVGYGVVVGGTSGSGVILLAGKMDSKAAAANNGRDDAEAQARE